MNTRETWKSAHRLVRIAVQSAENQWNPLFASKFSRLEWKIYCMRHMRPSDRYAIPAYIRIEQNRIADEIIDEILREENAK